MGPETTDKAPLDPLSCPHCRTKYANLELGLAAWHARALKERRTETRIMITVVAINVASALFTWWMYRSAP